MTFIKYLQPVATIALWLLATAVHAQDPMEPTTATPPGDQVVPVADEEPTVPEDSPAPEITVEQELMYQFDRYKQLMQDKVYDEADTVAKKVVELAIQVSGPQSNDTAKALTNLAIVQHHNEQYDAAQQNFESAIGIIEDNEDRLNGQLVNPLKGLGAAQLEGGRPDLAENTFRRAVHVTHVNEGPHNLDQVTILESLAEANLRLGSIDVAKEVQDTIYAINLRNFSGSAMDLVPALMRRAAWQHRAGFIFDERTTYRRIIRIIEDSAGKNDLQLIEPLTRLGLSFFYVDTSGTQSYQSSTMTSGEIYFKRAARIAEEHPDSDWEVVASTTLALGDYYMFEGSEQRARKVYQDAWDLLSEDEERLNLRRKALEELVTLRERPIPQYIADPTGGSTSIVDGDVIQGRVAVTYVVSSSGRATDIKLLEAEPPEFTSMLRNVQREMRRRIYRPYFDDTGPIDSPEQILTHRFYYRQADLDAIRGEATAAEQPDPDEG